MQNHALSVLVVVALAAACGGKEDAGDAGTDASNDVDGAACTYAETRTQADRTCSASSDCVTVTRELSCCQSQYEGIRGDAAPKFQAQQDALTAACPACGCAAQPVDEFGNKGVSFTATCDNGACTAHAQ